MINQFNIDKISKSGAQFDFDKLEFLNQMHLREAFSFTEGNLEEVTQAVEKWREMMEEEMPREVLKIIRKTSDEKMFKIMQMMTIRMRYMSDIKNHTYFFTLPDYQTDLGKNFLLKLKQTALINKQILSDLQKRIEKISAEDFNATSLNKVCSIYLFDTNEKKKG